MTSSQRQKIPGKTNKTSTGHCERNFHPECSTAFVERSSDLKRPGLAVGRARWTHPGKMSRKRSEVVPAYDAQLPGVGGPDTL